MSSSHKPLVSILINSFNYEKYLTESINSALAQTYNHIEVIVVDDGSTDSSPKIIASYGDKLRGIYQSNQGQAAAFNHGFAESKGELICFLDADDIFHSQKVETLVKASQENLDAEWFLHPLLLFNQDNKQNAVTQSELKYSKNQIQIHDVRQIMELGKLGNPFSFPVPPTSGMSFSRKLADKLLPMPLAEGIILNDSYLKFAALGISKGVTIDYELAYQRIHDRNLFTTIKNTPDSTIKQQQTTTSIFLSTGYWLKTKFPTITKFADNLFTTGLVMSWRLKSEDLQDQIIIKKYFKSSSLSSFILIYLKSFYKYLFK